MSAYRRLFREGGTYFFTIVTERRAPIFDDVSNVERLRAAIARCRTSLPFDIVAGAVLPDHLHVILTLPDEDHDFSTRLRFIKSNFTDVYLAAGGVEQSRSASRVRSGDRGIWQRRFWEHLCRDETDLRRHVEYIHFNAVKHGLARCPHEWPHSSFHRWVMDGRYRKDWCCVCNTSTIALPDFSWASDDM